MTPVHPQKLLTVSQMKAVDHQTIEAGIPGLILMENAAHGVAEYIKEHFKPVSAHKIVVICGKGNNGGDGLAVARILRAEAVLIADPEELTGDAAANLKMFRASGLREHRAITDSMRNATLVIDAVLGTGLTGAAKGKALEAIRAINTQFPQAKVIAVDIPSGLAGDSATPPGEYVRADATITFTAPKICHALPPARSLMGDLKIEPIGSPPAIYDDDPSINLALITPKFIAPLFAPRKSDSN